MEADIDEEDSYKLWFDRDHQPGKRISALQFPAMQLLMCHILDNIVVPYPSNFPKVSLNKMTLFCLKHLLCKDQMIIDLPYAIIEHMKYVQGRTNDDLVYVHVIHWIFEFHNEPDLPTNKDLKYLRRNNLVDSMPKYGWCLLNKTKEYYPNPANPRNGWIVLENAAPNQYRDPSSPPSQSQIGQSSTQSAAQPEQPTYGFLKEIDQQFINNLIIKIIDETYQPLLEKVDEIERHLLTL